MQSARSGYGASLLVSILLRRANKALLAFSFHEALYSSRMSCLSQIWRLYYCQRFDEVLPSFWGGNLRQAKQGSAVPRRSRCRLPQLPF